MNEETTDQARSLGLVGCSYAHHIQRSTRYPLFIMLDNERQIIVRCVWGKSVQGKACPLDLKYEGRIVLKSFCDESHTRLVIFQYHQRIRMVHQFRNIPSSVQADGNICIPPHVTRVASSLYKSPSPKSQVVTQHGEMRLLLPPVPPLCFLRPAPRPSRRRPRACSMAARSAARTRARRMRSR